MITSIFSKSVHVLEGISSMHRVPSRILAAGLFALRANSKTSSLPHVQKLELDDHCQTSWPSQHMGVLTLVNGKRYRVHFFGPQIVPLIDALGSRLITSLPKQHFVDCCSATGWSLKSLEDVETMINTRIRPIHEIDSEGNFISQK